MNKEEILEKSRKENRNKDIYEEELIKQGSAIVNIVMVILATVFFVIQVFTGVGINYGLYAIVFCHSMVLSWIKWRKLRQRQQFFAVIAVYGLCFTVFNRPYLYSDHRESFIRGTAI